MQAAELGYEALALTDHDGLYGSLEFAHAAKAFGVRPITGAELSLTDGSHVTLLVETPRGYSNLCRLITTAFAHTRPKEGADPLPPALDQRLLEESNEGLVCLSGCARQGLAVRRPNSAASLARAFGPERFFVELQRPYERGRRPAERGAARARRRAGRADGRDRRRARAPSTSRAAPGRAGRDQAPDLAGRLRTRAAWQPRECPPPALGDGGAFPGRSGSRRARRRAGGPTRVRPDPGARLSLSGLLGRGRAGDRAAHRGLQPRLRREVQRRERSQEARAGDGSTRSSP